MCSQSLPLFSAAMWAQQGTAHFTLLFMVQVSYHILKESFPQKTLPLKIFSHRSHFSQMCENCRSSGWLYESERKTVSLEHQAAPLRNWSYLREVTHQILGLQAVPAEGLVLEKQQFRKCLEELQDAFSQSDCLWPQHFSLPQALCPFCQPWLSNHNYFLISKDRRGNVNFLLTN